MAKQIINIGTKVNSGGGDPLRTAFTKTNENFTELYSRVLTAEGQLGISNVGGVTIEQSIIGSVIGADSTVIVDYKTATITGKLVGDVTGSLFGDDSTILVDGVNSSINLAGTVKGDILPDTNLTYDIGSPTKRFKDIYLSSNTINLGGTALSVTAGKLQVGGTDVGNTISFSELSNKPTTLAGYGITDAMTAGGNVEGNLKGSVFADDSTLLVDGVAGTINGSALTSPLTANLTINSPVVTGIPDFTGCTIVDIKNTAVDFTGSTITGTNFLTTVAFADVTLKPTTLAGYGITDSLQLGTSATTALAGDTALFSGAFADLTSKPTTIAGYGITDAFDGAFSSLSGKPTTLAGYGITDAFDGTFTSLTGKPYLFLKVASSGQNDIVADGTTDKLYIEGGTGISITTDENTDTLTITATGSSSAADDITTGDAAVSIATTTGDITIDAQGSDTDIIFKGTDDASDITALTLDMSEAGKAIFNDDMQLGTSGHYLTFDRGNTTIVSTNNPLKLDANGAHGVQIQYGGSTKLTTTNTGANVTGNLGVSGDITNSSGELVLKPATSKTFQIKNNLGNVVFQVTSGDVTIDAQVDNADIIFKGTDDTADITALTLDMSDAGKAVFNNGVKSTTAFPISAENGNVDISAVGGNVTLSGDTSDMTFTNTGSGIFSFGGDIKAKTSTGATLTLQTSDTAVASGDVYGKIDFQAPDEADGSAAVLVGGGITLQSTGTSNNIKQYNEMQFRTSMGTQINQANMTLSGEGDLTIAKGLTSSTSIFSIYNSSTDGQIWFRGSATGGQVTALKLDIGNSGKATFNGGVEVSGANIDFTNLPTSDPAVAGRLWRSGNDVKISTG